VQFFGRRLREISQRRLASRRPAVHPLGAVVIDMVTYRRLTCPGRRKRGRTLHSTTNRYSRGRSAAASGSALTEYCQRCSALTLP
jgi:hypothetical protein